jgi:hypothetical protein
MTHYGRWTGPEWSERGSHKPGFWDGTDPTEKKHRDRIEMDHEQLARWSRQRRTPTRCRGVRRRQSRKAKRVLKQAKGLGK